MNFDKLAIVSLLLSQVVYAGGYKIPESSLRATALSTAYIANSNGADANYYNPANLVGNDDINQMNVGITYIGLPKNKFISSETTIKDGKSKSETFFVPYIHYASKEIDGLRYGLSIVSPAGLSKRWDSPYQKASAEEFTLKVVEINPCIAKQINDKMSLGIGARVLFSDGIVKSSSPLASRDMTGNSIDYGYNLALNYQISSDIKISSTYRSKVNMKLDGNAKLYAGTTKVYDGEASVSVPVPSSLVVAMSYSHNKTTYEIVYDKTNWSEYKTLDFEYDSPIPAGLKPYFDDPILKEWKDSIAYRLGITHQYNKKLDLMFGYAVEKTPIPDAKIGFDLPDSDAKIYSAGFEYKYSKTKSFGMSYLSSVKSANNVNNSKVKGKFYSSKITLITFGFSKSF